MTGDEVVTTTTIQATGTASIDTVLDRITHWALDLRVYAQLSGLLLRPDLPSYVDLLATTYRNGVLVWLGFVGVSEGRPVAISFGSGLDWLPAQAVTVFEQLGMEATSEGVLYNTELPKLDRLPD